MDWSVGGAYTKEKDSALRGASALSALVERRVDVAVDGSLVTWEVWADGRLVVKLVEVTMVSSISPSLASAGNKHDVDGQMSVCEISMSLKAS